MEGIDEDGNIQTGYHIRMKSIPNSCILYTAEQRSQTIEELYMELSRGNEIEFDLLESKNPLPKCKFDKHSNLTIGSRKEFVRNIKF